MKLPPAAILGLAYFTLAGQITVSHGLGLTPSISVIPDYNAVFGENLTILCQGPEDVLTFTLLKDGNVSQVQPASGQEAEFHVIGAGEGDAGRYACRYHLIPYPSGRPESGDIVHTSEILDISIRERYVEPSIIVLPGSVIGKGAALIIICSALRQSMTFRLFKDNVIFQQEDSVEHEAIFSVMQATENDTGQYICYYCSRSGVTETCSELSNPVLINVTELPKPEISWEKDPAGSYLILCSAPEEHLGSWFLLFRGFSLIGEEKAEADAMQVTFAVNHSTEAFRCLYRVRVLRDLADSPFSDSIIIDKDFHHGNILRFLLSGLVLSLTAMIIIEFWCHKRNANWTLTRRPAHMAVKEDFQTDPSDRESLQSADSFGDCVEDAV